LCLCFFYHVTDNQTTHVYTNCYHYHGLEVTSSVLGSSHCHVPIGPATNLGDKNFEL
jgi:hypothetical protein